MNLRATLGSLLGLLCLADHAAAQYIAPSTEAKFLPVLSHAKLQYPESGLSASPEDLYNGFAKWHFQLVDSDLLQFKVKGSSRRSELRQMKEFGSEIYWAVDDGARHTLTASLSIPEQENGIEEVTVMQVHGGAAPILRISWMDSISISGNSYNDVVVSTVRVGLGSSSNNFVKTVLGQRTASLTDFRVEVYGSKLNIVVNGSTKVNNQDLSFWNGDDTAYFKAGAYNNHPSDTSATACSRFDELIWV